MMHKSLLILFTLLCLISHPSNTFAQTPCCSWAGDRPYAGKCLGRDCVKCLTTGLCDTVIAPQVPVPGLPGTITVPKPQYCQMWLGLAGPIQCKRPDPNDPINQPGQICDENALPQPVCVDLAPPEPPSILCSDNSGERCVVTAIGEVKISSPGAFANQFIAVGISIAGGVALLLIMYSTYIIISSQGNPEGINHGKEVLTSAIIGLVFIILSVTIIQIIGFDILGLGTYGLGTR